jgi:hypothetical protein
VKVGDTVVVEGSDRLGDGMPVQPVASAGAASKGAPAPGGSAAGDPK